MKGSSWRFRAEDQVDQEMCGFEELRPTVRRRAGRRAREVQEVTRAQTPDPAPEASTGGTGGRRAWGRQTEKNA